MARAKDRKAKSRSRSSSESPLKGDKIEERSNEPIKKAKAWDEQQSFLVYLFYKAGSISKNAAVILKESLQAETYKDVGKAIGSFRNSVESGWRFPDEIFTKNKIKINGKPFGLIAGSFTKRGLDELARAYRNARAAILFKMWKAEHPGASEAEKKKIFKDIEELFNK